MYLEHFGLTEPPFRITPHTDFFFSGGNRGATLDALIYAITHDQGIVKVSGEVGSGKTMLCRVLMERLPKQVTIVYLANPSLSRDDILYAIADELDLSIPENTRVSVVMRALQDHLIQAYGDGKQVVVLVDEAHAMPADTLEEIRLLSNLESNHSKLLQLVLFGQPELNDILARPDMRQLKERITHNFMLEPLIRDDIASYLDFRMRAAGYKGPSLFSPQAVKLIAKTSLGLTRRINILADKALLAAYASGSHAIGPREAQTAVRDSDFSQATYCPNSPSGGLRRAAVPVAIAIAIAIAYYSYRSANPSPEPVAGAPDQPPATQAATPQPTTPLPKAGDPAAATEGKPPPDASGAVVASPAAGSEDGKMPIAAGKLTRKALADGSAWLAQAGDARWFLQLYAVDADAAGTAENFLRAISAQGTDMTQVRAYASGLSGKDRVGIIYGDYPSSTAAVTAGRQLPPAARQFTPYPRQVSRLR